MMTRVRAWLGVLLIAAATGSPLFAQTPAPEDARKASSGSGLLDQALHEDEPLHDIQVALVRLPLAAALGATLALRPRRRGTPPRTPAVLQTQIILSIVGAV